MTALQTAAQSVLDTCTDAVAGWQSRAPLAVRAAALESLDALRAALAQEQAEQAKTGVWMHPWPPVRAQQAEPVQGARERPNVAIKPRRQASARIACSASLAANNH